MPRRKPKPSLWQRLLNALGIKSAKATRQSKSAVTEASSESKETQENGRSAAQNAAGNRARRERPKRQPELVEVTSGRLYVGNLSYDATESDLHELFNGVGTVQSAEVVYHRRTHRSKGYAFVQLQSVEEAKRAVDVLHDKEYMGRKLVISGAKEPAGEPNASRGAA